jgi:hypothetical protein
MFRHLFVTMAALGAAMTTPLPVRGGDFDPPRVEFGGPKAATPLEISPRERPERRERWWYRVDEPAPAGPLPDKERFRAAILEEVFGCAENVFRNRWECPLNGKNGLWVDVESTLSVRRVKPREVPVMPIKFGTLLEPPVTGFGRTPLERVYARKFRYNGTWYGLELRIIYVGGVET